MAQFTMDIQGKSQKFYVPSLGEFTIRQGQTFQEEGSLGKELIKYHGEHVRLDGPSALELLGNSKNTLDKLEGLKASASEIDDAVVKKQVVLPKALISIGENIVSINSLADAILPVGEESKVTLDSDVNIFGNKSIKMTETELGSNIYSVYKVSPFTLLDKDIFNVLLWADAFENYGNIAIQFCKDANFYNYHTIVLKTKMIPKVNEWNNIPFTFSDMTQSGTASYKDTILYVRVLAFGAAGKIVNVKFGGLKKGLKSRPAITFSFDDCNQTDYTVAFPKLEQYGFKATTFIISEEIGTTVGVGGSLPRLTLLELKALYDNGWYIGIHGKDYFNWVSESTIAEAETRIKNCKEWLYDNGFIGKGLKHCAYPHGQYNDAVIAVLKKYGIKYGRTTNLLNQQSPVEDMYKLKLGVGLGESLETNIAVLEALIKQGGLINVYTHELYGEKAVMFGLFVDYINEHYRRYVTTIPDWVDEYETGTII